jgi:hypothetical protein
MFVTHLSLIVVSKQQIFAPIDLMCQDAEFMVAVHLPQSLNFPPNGI